MNTKALLLELLLSGFFAIACFRARGGDLGTVAVKPRDFLRLTDRLERLSLTRWQWFSMVLVVVFVRLQSGVPLVVELTAALQFVIFLSLPVQKQQKALAEKGSDRPKYSARLTPRHVSSGKA
ncbi:MAG: hypothetical protein WA400_05065 [Silvibacterium sp.]